MTTLLILSAILLSFANGANDNFKGLLRKEEANWGKVREILLAWVATLPLGAVSASLIFAMLRIWARRLFL